MIKIIGGQLYQWDTYRQIEIELETDKVISEIHFASQSSNSAAVVIPEMVNGVIRANIPNRLLQKAESILVYAVTTSDAKKETVKGWTISVTGRPRPTDYVYSEIEIFEYRVLSNRIKTLEDYYRELANIQSDWNAEEGERGYIANKPFGEEIVDGETVVKPLEEKYLPKSVATKEYVDECIGSIETGGDGSLENHTHDERYYTQSEVDEIRAALETLIDAKPSTLVALGITATVTELNHMTGVTSKVQEQLNKKLDASKVVNDFATTEDGFALAANLGPTIAAGLIHYADVMVILPSLTWRKSGTGLYYTDAIGFDANNGLSVVLAATIIGFSSIRSTDVITPMLSSGGIDVRLAANVNEFASETSSLTLRVLYLA